MTPTEQDKKIRYILLYAYYQGKDNKGYSDTQLDNDMSAITSLIKEAVKSYEDNLLSTIDDISNKPWRAARHIRELYENTDSGIDDWYKQVADDWGLLEEFFSNGGMAKVRELMADPNFNVNYPERQAKLKQEIAKVSGGITANQLLNHIADGMRYDKTFTYTELEEALEALREHKEQL